MRANAAGALGNLVRNGGQLMRTVVNAGVIDALLQLALNDKSLEARRISLFSLGNILKSELGRRAALRPELRLVTLLEAMANSATDNRIARNFKRIQRILREPAQTQSANDSIHCTIDPEKRDR
uniref:non-specific serine/threonine protein kinase n=2 Tax=Lotharella globosa TaxID=91324 RepID=A0A7S3ZHY7_9EUKA